MTKRQNRDLVNPTADEGKDFRIVKPPFRVAVNLLIGWIKEQNNGTIFKRTDISIERSPFIGN